MAPCFTSSFHGKSASCDNLRVLLIDPDCDFRSALAANLRDDGHPVDEFDAPRRTPPITALGNVSVVMSDYDFLNEDGISFSDRFNRGYPRVPIVLLTAHHGSYIESAVRLRNFLHLVRKPLDYERLHTFMHELVGGGRS